MSATLPSLGHTVAARLRPEPTDRLVILETNRAHNLRVRRREVVGVRPRRLPGEKPGAQNRPDRSDVSNWSHLETPSNGRAQWPRPKKPRSCQPQAGGAFPHSHHNQIAPPDPERFRADARAHARRRARPIAAAGVIAYDASATHAVLAPPVLAPP